MRFTNDEDEGKWPPGLRFALRALAYLALAGACVFSAFYLVVKLAEPQIPPGADLYALNRPHGYTILDADGNIAGMRGALVGERLALSEMPRYLPAAFLAMEDRRFYYHGGIDAFGLLRAAIVDYRAGRYVQGGSTITQQLVKLLFLTPDRTLWRKVRETGGAWAIEERLTKDQILELYLNRIYLGSGAFGVDGAAHVYFGKSARDVTLSEAAMLAALTTAPSTFSPRRDLTMAQARADLVLTALVETGYLSQAEVAYARAHPANIVDKSNSLARNYYLDAAVAEAKTLAPGAEGDLVIATALDLSMQEAAREAVNEIMDKQGAAAHATQAALVAMTPEGAVRALIGGRDYAQSNFNRATQAHRQPGSAFKPFVYLTALERGLGPSTVRVDSPVWVRNWSPDNYGGSNVGAVTLQQALTRSINTVAVKLGQEAGPKRVVEAAHRAGIVSPLKANASLALGTSEVTPFELTAAYGTFASGGLKSDPYTVREIRAGDGTVLFSRSMEERPRVIEERNALTMNGMLYQVVQNGTARRAAVPGHQVAGKTGTSADWRDAWFVGFSADLVAGVWIGNDDAKPMDKVTGGGLPAEIWSGFMRTALMHMPAKPLLMNQQRSEPLIAEDDGDRNEGFVARGLDRVGTFLGSLFEFGSDSEPRRDPAPPARTAYDSGLSYPDAEERPVYSPSAGRYRDDARRTTAELNEQQYTSRDRDAYVREGMARYSRNRYDGPDTRDYDDRNYGGGDYPAYRTGAYGR